MLLVLHGLIGAVLFPSGSRFGRRGFLIGGIAPLVTFVWLLTQLPDVLDGKPVVQHIDWVPQLGIDIDLRLDGFGALMVLLVAGIGIAIAIYSTAYFSSTSTALGRTSGLLAIFAGAMLCVVMSDNLLVLYTGWELTSITSYLLIGNDHTKIHARAAALHALLVTSLGGLAMLGGFVLIGQAAGTYRISQLLAMPPSGTTVSVGLVLVLIGAFTKSAQYPFHSWLPGAMAAPTPVSAYLHSATMVKAGIYLIARFAPAFATAGIWRPLVLIVGSATMIFGGLRALRQHDLKLLLAHGTVSQLGFLVVLFGIGTPEATAAGCAMLLAHALFKASLFMSVGTLDRLLGTRDVRFIPRMGAGWHLFRAVTIASAASMAGIPLLFGFVAKESGFDALQHAGVGGDGLALAGVVIGSALTAAYTARLLWGMFSNPDGRHGGPVEGVEPPTLRTADRPEHGYISPIIALSIVTVGLGVVPSLGDRLIGAAAGALDPGSHGTHLALWHGTNLALLMSAIAVAGGLVLFTARTPVDHAIARGGAIPNGTAIYTRILRGTNNGATRLTGVIQNGSLPIYAGTVLFTAALVPGIVLLTQTRWPGWPAAVGSWAQLPIVLALLGAAIAAAAVRRRFSAALFLGTVGYSMAGLFVVQGAPDLALTQVAIETLSTVLFVLVLRRLPDRFERTSTSLRRVVRVVISLAVGVLVFTFAIISRGNRVEQPVSGEMIERSLPDAHGRNVVNVILVDIRGFDTLGEITVLASAGIGAVALARVGRRRKSASRAPVNAPPEVTS
ncbi:MAG: hydrogen gas-evolving membrane-bound hydrogenase subunit E [Ilumatobacteraceae bacterium]